MAIQGPATTITVGSWPTPQDFLDERRRLWVFAVAPPRSETLEQRPETRFLGTPSAESTPKLLLHTVDLVLQMLIFVYPIPEPYRRRHAG